MGWIALIALAALAADQISKLIVCGFFFDPQNPLVSGVLSGTGESIEVIPKGFSLTYVLNRGAAFGILQNQRIFFLIITAVVCAGGVLLLLRIPKKHPLLIVSSGMIFGGAIGNLVDRLLIGSVRDFLEAKVVETVTGYSFPVFNVADICVVVGVILLAWYILFIHDAQKKRSSSEQEK